MNSDSQLQTSLTLDEKRYRDVTARISQRYDSQIDGYHVITERSIEETLGTIAQHDSKRVFTMDSIKSIKDLNPKSSPISAAVGGTNESNLTKIKESSKNEEGSPVQRKQFRTEE